MPLNLRVPNVLIVDDEPIVVQGARIALERWGCAVETAVTSAKAHELASAMEPLDVLVIDTLIGLDRGRDIAERLMLIHPEMRVVHMSGWPKEKLKAEHLLTPGAAFLPKPFSFQQLQSAVAKLLSKDDLLKREARIGQTNASERTKES